MNIIDKINEKQINPNIPEFRVGDTVIVGCKIIEENYGFTEEDGDFYRVSEVYRLTLDKNKQIVRKETVLKNHSKVLYDYSLIPENQIITPRLRRLECKK